MSKEGSSEAGKSSVFGEPGQFLISLPDRMKSLQKSHECEVRAALYDAVDLILQTGSQTPEWVLEAVLKLLGETMEARTGTARYRQDMKDFRRYQAFKTAKSYGQTDAEARDTAVEVLDGTFAAVGSSETIKTSVSKVKKKLIEEKGRYAYYPARRASQNLTNTPTWHLKHNSKP